MRDAQPSRTLRVPWGAWHGDAELELEAPRGWSVAVCEAAGGAPLDAVGVAASLDRPIGSSSLEELVRGRSSAAIVVEDWTRPSPTGLLLPLVVERLARGGIPRERCVVLIGLGGHARMSTDDVRLKLGPASRGLEIVQHDPRGDLVTLGMTRRKTPVTVHRRFSEAGFRISLGTILPHPFAGFGGGAKLVMPGISGIESLVRNHKSARIGLGGPPGVLEGNAIREDIEDAGEIAGLDAVVDCIVDSRRRILGVVCGAPRAAHRAGSDAARRFYATSLPSDPVDLVILNAYPKDTELVQIGNAFNALRSRGGIGIVRPGGVVAVLAACPRGVGGHDLFEAGGELYSPPRDRYFPAGPELAVISPGLTEVSFRRYYGRQDLFFQDWTAFCEFLSARFPDGGTAVLLPAASAQLVA